MSVKIERVGDALVVRSPYHPDLPARAKRLGGRWDAASKTWRFDARDEERVRALCRDVYGTDGADAAAADVVTVRLTVLRAIVSNQSAIYCGGREVCGARGRDSGARLGSGVVLLTGRMRSGGSARYWQTIANAGCVFEVRDLPRAAVPASDDDWTVEIVESDAQHDAALAAARARVGELEAALSAARAEVERLERTAVERQLRFGPANNAEANA